MRCEGCNQERDDVAVVSFQWVISVIFMTFRNPVVGAYCKRCRVIRGVGLSVVSSLVGWWGFPWGLVYTPAAIAKNIASIFATGAASTPLIARVVHRSAGPDVEHEHFAVELRGQQMLPSGYSCWLRHSLVDVTNPAHPQPVLALLDWQQAGDSRIFLDVTSLGTASAGQYLDIGDWIDVDLPIFPPVTLGPHGGRRELLSVVELMRHPDVVIWSQETPFSIDLPLEGYVEAHDRELADDGLIVRMAIAVAAASGDVASAEIAAIDRWIRTRVSTLDADNPDTTARRMEMEGARDRSVRDAEAGTLDLGATMSRFTRDGSEGGRIEALELCLAVMGADGRVDAEEMAVVNRLAGEFGIDESWFAERRDKSVAGLTLEAGSASDYATLLGIDVNADRETIRRQLNEQYDRWNSRAVSLADEDKRREAEEMLELIARARGELLS